MDEDKDEDDREYASPPCYRHEIDPDYLGVNRPDADMPADDKLPKSRNTSA